MLEGLEAAVLNFCQVKFDNDTIRIDSQYFKKAYLQEDLVRNKFKNVILGDIAFITDGQHGYHEVDERSNIRHLTAKNAKNWFADDVEADRLAKWVDEKNERSSLELNDLILSTRGTVGFCAIIGNDVLPANIDQDVARIKIEKNILDPTVILAYLNSSFGQDWIKRNTTGMVQQGLALWRVRELPVPVFNDELQKSIKKLIYSSQKKRAEFSKIYKNANAKLYNYLDLNNSEKSKEKINIKSFSESFMKSGRLDAEYYLPKYEEVVEKIKSQAYGRLEELTKIVKSVEPGTANYSDQGIPFVRVADYDKFGIEQPEVCIKEKYCNEHAKKINKLKLKKDTVLLSKDGSVGIAYNVKEDRELLTSSAILHLRIKDKDQLLPEYLALVLNSQLTQMQAERDGGGSIILHWRMGDVKDVLIPVIDFKKQKEINDLVEESFKLKKQSKALLQTAKRAVEIAIEENEEAALSFISEKVEATL